MFAPAFTLLVLKPHKPIEGTGLSKLVLINPILVTNVPGDPTSPDLACRSSWTGIQKSHCSSRLPKELGHVWQLQYVYQNDTCNNTSLYYAWALCLILRVPSKSPGYLLSRAALRSLIAALRLPHHGMSHTYIHHGLWEHVVDYNGQADAIELMGPGTQQMSICPAGARIRLRFFMGLYGVWWRANVSMSQIIGSEIELFTSESIQLVQNK